MTSLLRLLRDDPDAVEADLSQHHHLDLRDLWRRPQRLTYRQVLVRVKALPPESATKTVLRDGGPAWTTAHELLDALRMSVDAGRGVPTKDIKPHPTSPHRKPEPDLSEARRRRHEASKARELARQHRLEGGS